MTMVYPSRLLKNALRADALVSSATGALQLAATDPLASLLDLPTACCGRRRVHARLRRDHVADGAASPPAFGTGPAHRRRQCVVGLGVRSTATAGLLAPNAWGVGFLAMHAVAVVLLAVLQWMGLQRSARPLGRPVPNTATLIKTAHERHRHRAAGRVLADRPGICHGEPVQGVDSALMDIPRTPQPRPAEPTFGEHLRQWRQRRRMSQLDLSVDADVSTRISVLLKPVARCPAATWCCACSTGWRFRCASATPC